MTAVPFSGSASRRRPADSAGYPFRSDADWVRTLQAPLRLPLIGKLLGANLVLAVGAGIAHGAFPRSAAANPGILLGLSFAVTALLVWLAVRPIALIESTAQRVSEGDFGARVPSSPLADRNAMRLAATMNRLLDRVESDRSRIQHLAGRAVRARDVEREAVARELRESFAQSVAAIGMQIAALRPDSLTPMMARQLEAARESVHQLTEDMKHVADTLYPGTLLEFGLENALGTLIRRIARRSPIHVRLDTTMFTAGLSPAAANALYRTAREALQNAEQHSHASHVRLVLRSNGEVTLDIEDDGRGFDLRTTDPLQAGLGLFSARAVLALAGGTLQISSAPDMGTRIVARVPAAPPRTEDDS